MKALLIIDMQMEMQHRIQAGVDCVNADAPDRINALASFHRGQGWPVIHIRHSDDNPHSPFHWDAKGCPPMACAEAAENEAVFFKRTSSAFASTGLADYLNSQEISDLIVVGAVAGFCVNSTVRAGSDLGFKITVVEDAVVGFGLPESGQSAHMIFDATMALLRSDFAEITMTAKILNAGKVQKEM